MSNKLARFEGITYSAATTLLVQRKMDLERVNRVKENLELEIAALSLTIADAKCPCKVQAKQAKAV